MTDTTGGSGLVERGEALAKLLAGMVAKGNTPLKDDAETVAALVSELTRVQGELEERTGECRTLRNTGIDLLTRAEAAERRNTELEAGLRRTSEGVDAALNMVEGDGMPPDWDWLREIRDAARSLLQPKGEADV